MKIVAPVLSALALPVVVALVSGCTTPARGDHMAILATPQQRMVVTPLRNNVAVLEVSGGQGSNRLWTSKVDNAQFAEALALSLGDAGLLAADPAAARYSLSARMEKLEQPLTGMSLTVTATVSYSLVERASGNELLHRTHTLPYTAPFGDTFGAIDRMRLANEGAVKANIAALVDDLVTLPVAAGGRK
ncbi:hypothetical protein [Massilia sp. DWR3-1-1]|uniref:hypothetical protein n=1 Tax=Massilia sp. DWR3-1-1 TaxID=2804559 RepID=UPI003CED4980